MDNEESNEGEKEYIAIFANPKHEAIYYIRAPGTETYPMRFERARGDGGRTISSPAEKLTKQLVGWIPYSAPVDSDAGRELIEMIEELEESDEDLLDILDRRLENLPEGV